MQMLHRRLGAPAAGFCFALMASTMMVTMAAQAQTGPIVATQSGQVQGFVADGVQNFFGIPYAQPPVGALRWTDPAPPAAWTGVRAATSYGNYCPQGFSEMGAGGGNEDCLYLNIQVPKNATVSSKLPVMFWIHGGGLTVGSGQEYNGAALASEGDVVFVSINYRLGLLGFLATAQFTAENPHARSGNYGLLDQQAALAWVRQNIAAFGGDPTRVTIFGESAGGLSTMAQLTSPTLGPIQGAIMHSGNYLQQFQTLAAAQTGGQTIATSLGCGPSTDVATCLRAIPAMTLVGTQSGSDVANATNAGLSPNIDNYMLTHQPFDAFLTGNFAQVPIINGTNHDEYRLFVSEDELLGGAPYNKTTYHRELKSIDPKSLAIYPLSDYRNPDYAVSAAGTDYGFSCPAHILDIYASRYVPVYNYELADPNWPNELLPHDKHMPTLGDPHASDLSYFYPKFDVPALNLPPSASKFSADQQELAKTMRRLWTSFAHTGKPVAPGGLVWPAFSPQTDGLYKFVPPQPVVAHGFYDFHHCDFWVPFILNASGLPAGSVN